METRDGAERASISEAGERLRDYDRVKLKLSRTLQHVLHLINEQTQREQHDRCRNLLSRLAEDRFVLAVVGQFNRGKSSLMNGILGLDRLPVGIVPLTSVITKVAYGNPERVLIEFDGGSLTREISVDQLSEYVTEAGNPGNERRIAAAELQLPSEFLRRGLSFVDTPGVGSAIAANTMTTGKFLPEADAVVFVTSFDAPLGRDELEFLQQIRTHIRKVFFVVNKLDLVQPGQRDQVLTFIRERLEQELGLRDPRLFAVSARIGLEARLAPSPQRLAESGLPALEEHLIQFLTAGKTAEVLLHICDRALEVLGDLDPEAMPHEEIEAFVGLTGRLTNLHDQLARDRCHEEGRGASPRRGPAPRSEAELMNAVRTPCRVCTRVAETMFRFMAKFQYQVMINDRERSMLAIRGGLCPLHTW